MKTQEEDQIGSIKAKFDHLAEVFDFNCVQVLRQQVFDRTAEHDVFLKQNKELVEENIKL